MIIKLGKWDEQYQCRPDLVAKGKIIWKNWLFFKTEVMGFQLSYFKSWKMMLWKCSTQYASKFWKLTSGHDAKAETPVLWPPHVKSWLIGKDSDAGRDWRQEEKGTTEDEMAGWHQWLDGHESEWTPGVGDGQGGLACYDSWGRKESDMTECLNWTELNWTSGHRTGKGQFSSQSQREALLKNIRTNEELHSSQTLVK